MSVSTTGNGRASGRMIRISIIMKPDSPTGAPFRRHCPSASQPPHRAHCADAARLAGSTSWNRCGKPAGQAEERRSPSLHGAMHWRRARVPDLWLRYARCLCTPPNPGGALPRDESTLCFVVPVPLPSRSASLRRRFDHGCAADGRWRLASVGSKLKISGVEAGRTLLCRAFSLRAGAD